LFWFVIFPCLHFTAGRSLSSYSDAAQFSGILHVSVAGDISPVASR
jgi:hypothetical protein